MIGDPRDSGERTLNSAETVKDWVERVRRQIEPFLVLRGRQRRHDGQQLDWTAALSTIDFLRDIGKHFPVNRMLARDDGAGAASRPGISYTEFSYVLLQSMDFLNLYRDHGVTLQFGGSDQWGNITGGVELIRRADGGTAHAFATPLVTKADGTKYGKTEGGALWLDPEMMSPYAFYQFWLNVEDEKVGELLRIFTFLSARGDRGPRGADGREAVPARRPEGAGRARHHAGARRRGDRADQGRLGGAVRRRRPARARAPTPSARRCARRAPTTLDAADGMPSVVDLLVETGLAKSKGEARRTVAEGGAYLNNSGSRTPSTCPATPTCSGAAWLVLRRGKKNFAGVEVALRRPLADRPTRPDPTPTRARIGRASNVPLTCGKRAMWPGSRESDLSIARRAP